MVYPLEIAVSGQYAFVTSNNGNDTRPDSVFTIDLGILEVVKINPVGLLPSGLAYDSENDLLYTSNFFSRNITRLSLAELLP